MSTVNLYFLRCILSICMQSVSYSDLKKGELYAHYKQMSNKKLVMLFELTDSQPIMNSFSIIVVKIAWFIDEDHKFHFRENYVTNLPPKTDCLYHLDSDEYRNHFIIPQI